MSSARQFLTLIKDATFLLWLFVAILTEQTIGHLIDLVDHGGWWNAGEAACGVIAVTYVASVAIRLRRRCKEATIR